MTVEGENQSKKSRKTNEGSLITGVVLIALGILFLVDRYFPEVNFRDMWPFILIIIGALIIVRGRGR
jgi:uncharacterized membrane protein HdeD (DUF308 family)